MKDVFDVSLVCAGLEWEEIESSEGPALLNLQSSANGQVRLGTWATNRKCKQGLQTESANNCYMHLQFSQHYSACNGTMSQ